MAALIPGVKTGSIIWKSTTCPCLVATSSGLVFIQRTQEFFSLFDHIVLGDDPKIGNGKLYLEVFSLIGRGFPLLLQWGSTSSLKMLPTSGGGPHSQNADGYGSRRKLTVRLDNKSHCRAAFPATPPARAV